MSPTQRKEDRQDNNKDDEDDEDDDENETTILRVLTPHQFRKGCFMVHVTVVVVDDCDDGSFYFGF